MSEFESLISTICNSSSNIESRSNAERRLLEILSDASKWKEYLPILQSSNDTICFFLGIGYQRLVWRLWPKLSVDDQSLLTNAISSTLVNQRTLQNFTKAKLEQVLAAICANSLSLQPVLNLISETENTNPAIGISAIRTVFDVILSEDSKIDPSTRTILISSAQQILLPLTNLIGTSCCNAMQSMNENNLNVMGLSLELLKSIVSKLQIGPHISFDLLQLLFSIAELGADPSSMYHQGALSSMEILTEIMYKKYIPPSSSSSNSLERDAGVLTLMTIVSKIIQLLKSFREHGNIDDSPIALHLLEFISVFAESHLQRCFQASQISSNPTITQTIPLFFNELVSISTVSMDPKVLIKIIHVWKRVIEDDAVKQNVLEHKEICIPILSHLLNSCLLQSNSYLQDNYEEIIEDFLVEIVVDPHIKEILSKISMCSHLKVNKSNNEVLGAEENDYIGSSLLNDIVELIAEFLITSDLKQWMHNQTMSMLTQNISVLSSANNHASSSCIYATLDLYFLIRLLPMASHNLSELIIQIIQFAIQLIENNSSPNYSKERVVLLLNCFQMIGQILQTHASHVTMVTASAIPITTEWTQIIEPLFDSLLRGMYVLMEKNCSTIPTSGLDSTSNVLHSLLLGNTILLTQSICLYNELFEKDNRFQSQKSKIEEFLNKCLENMDRLPLDVYTLIVCSFDQLNPQFIQATLTNNLMGSQKTLDTLLTSNQLSSPDVVTQMLNPTLDHILRWVGSLDVLSRHASIAKPQKRQLLIASLSSLQPLLLSLLPSILQLTVSCWKQSFSKKYPSVFPPNNYQRHINEDIVFNLVKLLIAFISGLLQCLGKKTFGKLASDSLDILVNFVETCTWTLPNPDIPSIPGHLLVDKSLEQIFSINSSNPFVLSLFDSQGIKLILQILELGRILAESTASSSATVASQIQSTCKFLNLIIPYLSDERICAETLQTILRTGIVSVRCYWLKSSRPLTSNSFDSSASINNNGQNIQPLAEVLTQLCVGSLGHNVPPQDTLLALEGMISLKEQHNLFSTNWFQSECWLSLFLPTLRAMVLRMHQIHHSALESVFISLLEAKLVSIQSTVGLETSEGLNQARDFWMFVGQEIVNISNDYQCTDSVHEILSQVFATPNFPHKFDPKRCLDLMIYPVVAVISRRL